MTSERCMRLRLANLRIPVILSVLIGGLTSVANAEEFTSLSAHQHGHGRLSLVLDNGQLFVELSAPALNLLGVEHRSTAPEAQKQLQQRADYLKSLAWLTLATDANCQVTSVELMSPLLEIPDAAQIRRDAQAITDALWQSNDTLAKNSVQSGKTAEEPAIAEQSHKHASEHSDHAAEHSDVVVSASFGCAAPTKLTSVTVNLWQSTVALEEVSAQWILTSGQGAAVLTPQSPTLKL